MKRLFILCLSLVLAWSLSLSASAGPPGLFPALIDLVKPDVSFHMDCAGVFSGTATDKPDVATQRANLAIMLLDASSTNFALTHSAITPGTTVSATWQLKPIDYSKPGIAIVHFRDMASNDSTVTFTYTPRQLTVSPVTVAALYPGKDTTLLVPLINRSGDSLRLRSVSLAKNNGSFTLDASTPTDILMRKGDTVWVTMHFKATQSGQYSDTLRIGLGCDVLNVQLSSLSASVGTLELVVNDVDFLLRKAKTVWNQDLTAKNNGNLAATISSIQLKSGNQSFQLKNLISLPVTVAPGAQIKLADVEFAPLVAGKWLDNVSYDVVEDLVGPISTPVIKAESEDNVSVVEENVAPAVSLYPMPVNDVLIVNNTRGESASLLVELFDVHGQRVASEASSGGGQVQLSLRQFDSGLYICRVNSGGMESVHRVYIVR